MVSKIFINFFPLTLTIFHRRHAVFVNSSYGRNQTNVLKYFTFMSRVLENLRNFQDHNKDIIRFVGSFYFIFIFFCHTYNVFSTDILLDKSEAKTKQITSIVVLVVVSMLSSVLILLIRNATYAIQVIIIFSKLNSAIYWYFLLIFNSLVLV